MPEIDARNTTICSLPLYHHVTVAEACTTTVIVINAIILICATDEMLSLCILTLITVQLLILYRQLSIAVAGGKFKQTIWIRVRESSETCCHFKSRLSVWWGLLNCALAAKPLPVTLSGVDVLGPGCTWLQRNLVGRQVWFEPVAVSDRNQLECIVTAKLVSKFTLLARMKTVCNLLRTCRVVWPVK